ncbi:uncharacterized protein LOC118733910 [Rhagoletis pomonella]|uniref:uncharacterized protein LOC118733910 n=1 Tax=Rhagoletis pomonella TaxID=28610 RepID=UPI001780F309|nr:uncharacterized protein LOC118733910 [Rhagoletis pomonella]
MSEIQADFDVPSTSRGVSERNANVLTVAEVENMWNLVKIYKRLDTREKCIEFAEEQGLILRNKLCRIHKAPMLVSTAGNNTVGLFRCRKGVCRSRAATSRAAGTWFENAKISLPHIFYLMYTYASHWPQALVRKENFIEGSILSSATICDWYNYCREAVVLYEIDQQEVLGKIGGPGKIVQIDESKFGKRKYNKGRRVEGHWVLGMLEDGSEDIRLEVCPENIRSAEVLIPLIKKHVLEGSIICTDYWKAYDCLPNHGYEHRKVNHSDPDNPFVAEDGTHTQRIERQWRVLKRFFTKDNYNNPQNFADMMFEYMWRKKIARKHEDPYNLGSTNAERKWIRRL